jgi:hypothetical protein
MAKKRRLVSKNKENKDASNEPLYDKILNRLKNNPIIVFILIVAAAITGIITFIEPFQKYFAKKKSLVISTIRPKQDSANSLIDILVRNESEVDAVITKMELVIEEKWVDTTDLVEEIGPILGGSATYDFLLNPTDSIYQLDISQQVTKKSADRFFLVLALG